MYRDRFNEIDNEKNRIWDRVHFKDKSKPRDQPKSSGLTKFILLVFGYCSSPFLNLYYRLNRLKK